MTAALLSLVTVSLFLVLSQLSPGPDVFFVFRTALACGFRGGAAVSSGINAGFCIQALIVCTAGQWVMQQTWSCWVLLAAALWLLVLAWKIFPRSWKGTADIPEAQTEEGLLRLAAQGFLCNILNPKCGLFIASIALGPQSAYGNVFAWYTPALILALALSSQLGWMLWSALLQWHPIRGFYLRHTAVIDAAFALFLALFALLLIYDVQGTMLHASE